MNTCENRKKKHLKDVSCFIPFCSEANKEEWSRTEHMKKNRKKTQELKENTRFSFLLEMEKRRNTTKRNPKGTKMKEAKVWRMSAVLFLSAQKLIKENEAEMNTWRKTRKPQELKENKRVSFLLEMAKRKNKKTKH